MNQIEYGPASMAFSTLDGAQAHVDVTARSFARRVSLIEEALPQSSRSLCVIAAGS
jgi:hypothetical protein